MECKHIKAKDEWNETAGFFQKIGTCFFSGKPCQGGEEVCSKFEVEEEADKDQSKKMAEDEEKKEEEDKKEDTEEEKPAE